MWIAEGIISGILHSVHSSGFAQHSCNSHWYREPSCQLYMSQRLQELMPVFWMLQFLSAWMDNLGLSPQHNYAPPSMAVCLPVSLRAIAGIEVQKVYFPDTLPPI